MEGYAGAAGIVLVPSTSVRLLRKRKPKKAPALVPNAALNATGKSKQVVEMIWWYLEVILVTDEVGEVPPQMHIHHKYKGIGRDPDEFGSHRPLWLGGPALVTVV